MTIPSAAATERFLKLAGDFAFTEGPTCDSRGDVYFTDQPNDRIMKWSTDGKLTVFLQPCGRANGMMSLVEMGRPEQAVAERSFRFAEAEQRLWLHVGNLLFANKVSTVNGCALGLRAVGRQTLLCVQTSYCFGFRLNDRLL